MFRAEPQCDSCQVASSKSDGMVSRSCQLNTDEQLPPSISQRKELPVSLSEDELLVFMMWNL